MITVHSTTFGTIKCQPVEIQEMVSSEIGWVQRIEGRFEFDNERQLVIWVMRVIGTDSRFSGLGPVAREGVLSGLQALIDLIEKVGKLPTAEQVLQHCQKLDFVGASRLIQAIELCAEMGDGDYLVLIEDNYLISEFPVLRYVQTDIDTSKVLPGLLALREGIESDSFISSLNDKRFSGSAGHCKVPEGNELRLVMGAREIKVGPSEELNFTVQSLHSKPLDVGDIFGYPVSRWGAFSRLAPAQVLLNVEIKLPAQPLNGVNPYQPVVTAYLPLDWVI
ncbi:hypothetical protein ACYPKM_04715 [Pseudomonas aeruginosa]